MNRCILFLFTFSISLVAANNSTNVTVVQNSETPLIQVNGSVQQIQANGIYATPPAIANFTKLYGVAAADECVLVPFPDGSAFGACGDTWWTYPHPTTGNPVLYNANLDSMFLLPANDWSRCHGIESIDTQLRQGNQNPTPDYRGCAAPVYFQNPNHSSTEPIGQPLTVSGLSSGEDTLGFHIPAAGWLGPDGHIYLLYVVAHQAPNYLLDTILVKSDTVFPFAVTVPPKFTKLYTMSGLPPGAIPTARVQVTSGSADVTWVSGSLFYAGWTNQTQWEMATITNNGAFPEFQIASVHDSTHLTLSGPYSGPTSTQIFNLLPKFATHTGKFMYAGAVTATQAQIQARGWNRSLPAPLQSARSITCLTGSGFAYRRSNLYVACVDNALIDYSASNWWFVTGMHGNNPQWTQGGAGEANAIALLSTWNHGANYAGKPCIGEVDTKWYDPLGALVTTYGSYWECGGFYMRTANAPWGPYTDEQQFFNESPATGWGGELIYTYGSTSQLNYNFPPVYYADGVTPVDWGPTFTYGGIYGPFQLGQAMVSGTHVSILHTFSGFRPYTATLGRFTVQIPK